MYKEGMKMITIDSVLCCFRSGGISSSKKKYYEGFLIEKKYFGVLYSALKYVSRYVTHIIKETFLKEIILKYKKRKALR